MEEREIDLLDMIADILSHWRGLLAALIIGAILMGGLSYVKSYRNVQRIQSVEQEVLNRQSVDNQIAQLEQQLTPTQALTVQALIEQEKANARQKAYLENSLSMQLDPEQIAERDLIYSITMENPEQSCLLTQVYTDLINSTSMYQWIEEKTGIAANVVGELVYTEAGRNDSVAANLMKSNVKIIVRDAQEPDCDQLAEAVKEYMTEQQKTLEQRLGNHQLTLLSDTGATVADANLRNLQRNSVNDLATLATAVGNAKASLTEEQQQYYDLLTWEESEAIEAEQNDATGEQSAASPSISKKYVLLGAVLFAFVYAGILFLIYIFNSKIRVSDELQTLYHIPQIGVVVRDSGKQFVFDKWIDDLRHYGKRKFNAEQSMELAFAAVKIAAAKNRLNSICLMGCNLDAGAGKVCETLKTALEKEQLNVTILDNVLYNAEAMEKVDAMTGVVLVEKAGSTLYNEIAGELELLKRQEIAVLGGIIVE